MATGVRAQWLVRLAVFAAWSTGLAVEVLAQASDPYAITAEEKAACTTDAIRFCEATYPDERALLTCMRSNRRRLSSTCSAVFEAGLKRRGL